MAENDRIILNQILEQKNQEIGPDLDENEYFEVFSSEQILKNFELTYDEIESGIVDGGNDGGIDSIYFFVNGNLIEEDYSLEIYKRDISISLVIIQSKTSNGFSEQILNQLLHTIGDIFDLTKSIDSLQTKYNNQLLSIIGRFREVYEKLASKFPKLEIKYFYASKADEIHPKVKTLSDEIKTLTKKLFSTADASFDFLGAKELLELARTQPQTTFTLRYSDIVTSEFGGFVTLINLKNFFDFISDQQGMLRRNIFEANVRDYQGNTSVNEQIRETLNNPGEEDFWWLNNGITILSTKVDFDKKNLQIENPEIVNGLQTCAEIFEYLKDKKDIDEKRNLLVRIVITPEISCRDKIIKATNSQNTIPPAYLRATEKIHRDIEDFLIKYGWYYDRRKNFYKNNGKPIEKIISIPYLSQSLMAILLSRPDDARARPSSILNVYEDYEKLFNETNNIFIYKNCVELLKRIEKHLKTYGIGLQMDRKTRGDIKFHVATHISLRKLNEFKKTGEDLSNLNVNDLSEDFIEESVNKVFGIYFEMISEQKVPSDRVAKGPDFRKRIIENT
jgi:hypothetical protein